MTVRFVVDSSSLNVDGLSQETASEVLERLFDCIDEVLKDGSRACYDECLFNAPVFGELLFWDLWDPGSPFEFPRSLQERAAAIFGTLSRWDEVEGEWPESSEVVVGDGALEIAPWIAWAHAQSERRLGAVACICSSHRRPFGHVRVRASCSERMVWFVRCGRDVEEYFRWLIGRDAARPEELAEFSAFAFKGIDFTENCFSGIKNMSKPFREIRKAIVKHLSVISDEGCRIFRGDRQRVEAEFGALGVNISDENGTTKKDVKAKKARTLKVDGQDVFFWWHTKLELHQDRIHISPENVEQTGKILVGIFCKHLV